MITRIELDGFKTFQDFSLDLSPLQVIVGANGAGKSNLFDALRLLGRLAASDLRSAFQEMRGEVGDLFTIRADEGSSSRMCLAVEMLVNHHVQDDWGTRQELTYPRMRYELVIARTKDNLGLDRIAVEHEQLTPIPRHSDRWTKSFGLKTGGSWIPAMTGGRPSPFISTQGEGDKANLLLHQDGYSGGRTVVARDVERTLLSGIRNTGFPHAFAVAEEMKAWCLMHPNPANLRQPSPMTAPAKLAADGRHLPNVLARMSMTDPTLLADVSSDLADLVPGVLQVEVEEDRLQERNSVWVKMTDGRRFPSRVLSDGTLRMLALVTLRHDPAHQGLLCIEEPESSVHPSRLKSLTRLLKDLATDFSDPDQTELPLRQALCNTHSPVFISHSHILAHLLFAHMTTRSVPDSSVQPQLVTRIVPVVPDPVQLPLPMPEEERSFTLSEVQDYLESADLGEARRQLGTHLARANGQPVAEGVSDAPARPAIADPERQEEIES